MKSIVKTFFGVVTATVFASAMETYVCTAILIKNLKTDKTYYLDEEEMRDFMIDLIKDGHILIAITRKQHIKEMFKYNYTQQGIDFYESTMNKKNMFSIKRKPIRKDFYSMGLIDTQKRILITFICKKD